ncbi:hypothetical protein N8475_11590 [Winogradskyella sp.]|nr:hypothetical protein [Winogradskyella sp.]
MRLFKYLFYLVFVTKVVAQDCTVGDCLNGYGEKKSSTWLYSGNFKDGRMHGNGEYKWTDGASYVGEFREGFFEGNGIMTYSNGVVYEGGFKFDKRQGKGKITYSVGGSFSGDWQFGYRHGFGIYEDGKGYSYEGNYKFDEPNGLGKQNWSNGSVYEGDFKNGYRDGYGVYKWKSGETFKGNWKNGQKDGYGISMKNDLILKEGIWYKGEHKSNLSGCLKNNQECISSRICCRIKYENSEIYYVDNKKIKVSTTQLISFLEVYPKAKKRIFYDANWELTNPENSKYYRVYSDYDSISMAYTINSYYTSNNQLQWIGNVRNNNPEATNCEDAICEGESNWYYNDGQLSSKTNYLEGRKHGKTILYLRNGESLELNHDKGKYLKKE